MRTPKRLVAILVLILVSGCTQSGAPVANVSPASNQPSSSPTGPIPTPSPIGGTPAPAPAPASPSPTDTTSPSARSNATWVFDAAIGKILLFGGNTTSGNYNEFVQPISDTWTWDGSTWSELPAGNAPTARLAAGAAYDPIHKVVVLYGGVTCCSAYGDTWLWDGARWLLQGPPQSPGSGAGQQPMTWDSRLNVLLLYDWTGSYPAPALDQTWSWNGTAWKQLPTTSAPAGSQGFGLLVYDPGRKLTVFCGQSNNGPVTWTFDGTSWTQKLGVSGTASASFVAAEDDDQSDIVLYGENGDTWTWDGTRWTPANPLHSPGPRKGAAMTYDSAHHLVVLFGGSTGYAADVKHHNDVWTWDGQDWTKVSGS